ncbi:hypothetical protein EVC45_44375 [Paraburkholderia sp. UYCP14C]|uniref:hypothetical protein n=1 Tax=Paraburkholderia sp. UYCP14C TaxID=2511130 RepID=UPI001021385A|nr:hypothetical protein [Paraburkholderia sp. UYCP14C]RZF23466.1 hypothetical protein EVC45_44375 [Paraburkholderia sp. UYCP14C]
MNQDVHIMHANNELSIQRGFFVEEQATNLPVTKHVGSTPLSPASSGSRSPEAGDYLEQWSGCDIRVLVCSARDYVVYIDSTCQLIYQTTPGYDVDTETEDKGHFDSSACNDVMGDIQVLKETACESLTIDVRHQFLRILGYAMVCALEFDYSGAKKRISDAAKFIQARTEEKSRVWYLTASLLAAFPFLGFGAALWVLRDTGFATKYLGNTGLSVTLSGPAGALGALLSIILRTGKINVDYTAGKLLHWCEAGSRIIAGAISGVLVSLAVLSGMLLSPIANGMAASKARCNTYLV